jgi:hypothetical protein
MLLAIDPKTLPIDSDPNPSDEEGHYVALQAL